MECFSGAMLGGMTRALKRSLVLAAACSVSLFADVHTYMSAAACHSCATLRMIKAQSNVTLPAGKAAPSEK